MTMPAGPNRKIRSQSELARRLGLSDWTVSRAINGHPAVKGSTRERVLRAMSELGFEADPVARGLRGKPTGLIGIAFNELCNSVLLEKLASFERFLRANGLRSLLAYAAQNEAAELRAIADFRRLRVDGIVLLQSTLPAAQSSRALAATASVHVDPLFPQEGAVALVDRNRGVEELVHHLVGLGHRSFGTLGIADGNQWRQPGLRKALTGHGLDPSTHLKQYFPLLTPFEPYEAGLRAAEEVLSDPAPPTALIAISDNVALGAAQHLARRGVSIPGQCSVAGFDNLEIAQHLYPKLTTVDQQSHLLMKAAGGLLLDRLEGRVDPRSRAELVITPRLVVGESTGPSPAEDFAVKR